MNTDAPKPRWYPERNCYRLRLGGRTHYLKGSREEVDRQYKKLLAQHLSEDEESITLEDVIQRWRSSRKHVSISQDRFDKIVHEALCGALGEVSIDQLGPKAVKDLLKTLGADDRFARETINRMLRTFKQVVRFAVSEEIIDETTAFKLCSIDPLRFGEGGRETRPVEPVAEDQYLAVLPLLSDRYRTMLEVQRLTGCRPGEVIGLDWAEITTDRSPWEWKPSQHKTRWRGKHRVIYLGPKARSLLEVYHDVELPFNVHSSGYRHAIQVACRRAEVPSFTPNQVRHMRAAQIRREFGLDKASFVLGHSDAGTTERYSWKARSVVAQLMEEIG